MADISTELARILSAIYGEDVRGSIHDAIEKINDVSEKVIDAGTAVTSASSSSTGYYTDSLYVNTDTNDLWKCTGTDTWALIGNLEGAQGETGNGIESIELTSTSRLVDTYTITYTDGSTSTFTIHNGAVPTITINATADALSSDTPTVTVTRTGTTDAPIFSMAFSGLKGQQGVQGIQGETGETGNGIASIAKTSTSGLVDTYTITYSDSTTTTFSITNGNGIDNIAKTSTSGLIDTYTITYEDGTTTTFSVTNGKDGINGTNGTNGISVTGVTLVSKVGLVATYRMSFSDGSHFDYTVSDGAAGTGTGDMLMANYDNDSTIKNASSTGNGIKDYVASAISGKVDTAGDGLAKEGTTIALDLGMLTGSNLTKAVSGKDIKDALDEKADTSDIPTPAEKTAWDAKVSASLLKSTVGWTGKNKLPMTLDNIKECNPKGTWSGNTYAYKGITYTFTTNSEDSITKIEASGLVTDSSGISFLNLCDKLNISESLIINGCPNGGDELVYKLIATNTNGISLSLPEDYGSGANIGIITSDFRIQLRIYVRAGTVNNLTFYPMLRDASITDDTYEPYHESVEEEIEQIYADNGVLGAKNLWDLDNSFSPSESGSYTVNSGTLTISMTAIQNSGIWMSGSRVLNPRYAKFVGIRGRLSFDYKGDASFSAKMGYYPVSDSTQKLYNVTTNWQHYESDDIADLSVWTGSILFYNTSGASHTLQVKNIMLRLASDPDDTYVPYAMTNRELTEEKLSISELKTIASSAADFAAFKTAIANL